MVEGGELGNTFILEEQNLETCGTTNGSLRKSKAFRKLRIPDTKQVLWQKCFTQVEGIDYNEIF